jgi:serine protease Do
MADETTSSPAPAPESESASKAAPAPAPTVAPAPALKPASKPNRAYTPQRAKMITLAAAFMFSISAGFLGGWLGAESHSKQAVSNTAAQRQVVSSESNLISGIAKTVGPSVVSVNVTGQTAGQTTIFGTSGGSTQQSAGTGFIVSSDGVIVTNRHVVPAGTTSVNIVMSDGTEFDNVQVIGRTNDSDPLDVAFLKVSDKKGKTFTPVTLGDSSKMQIGEMVIAIGNALGQFQNTVTSGIISGHGRQVQAGDSNGLGNTENLQDLFQTDAAINEGNSGGPLVNADGQVIGINTAVAGNAQNIGFAIPINDLNTLIQSVLKSGKLERPYLGVKYVTLDTAIATQYGLSQKDGAYIAPSADGSGIVIGSPADKVGLQEKDIITKVDGTKLTANDSLSTVLGRHAVGDQVTLTVIRDGKTQTIKVKLAAAPTN